MARQDAAAVLDAQGALEETLDEVAPGAEEYHYQSEAHQVVTKAERRLRDRFGAGTFISIHMEPRKEEEAGE